MARAADTNRIADGNATPALPRGQPDIGGMSAVIGYGMANLPFPAEVFSAPERNLIRREFGQHFSSYPAVAPGILLRIWRAAARWRSNQNCPLPCRP